MVFPVTVLSLVVNISSQSKHIEGRGTERLGHSPNTLDLITDTSYAAEAFCSSFHSFICFMQVFKIFLTLFLMNPVHQISFFLNCFFVQKKHLSTSLAPSQSVFSAMRTHAPSLVGGLAAICASCLSENVRPERRQNGDEDGLVFAYTHLTSYFRCRTYLSAFHLSFSTWFSGLSLS